MISNIHKMFANKIDLNHIDGWATLVFSTPDKKMKRGYRQFGWNFRHWLHWKLSEWQLPVQPVTKISSKWWHFRFSEWPTFNWSRRCWRRCFRFPVVLEGNLGHFFAVVPPWHEWALVARVLMMEIWPQHFTPGWDAVFAVDTVTWLYVVVHLLSFVQEQVFVMFVVWNTTQFSVL